jgi:cell division protein FtsZ
VPANPFVEDSTPVSMASVLSTPSAPEQRANPRSSQAQPNYTDMAVPSVWRTNRVQAAAKVDALASGGMDDYEIPAFLRKQAD